MGELLASLAQIAIAGIKAIRDAPLGGSRTSGTRKGGELVLEADLRSNDAVLAAARHLLPGVPVHSEESHYGGNILAGEVLVVDPLDGTTNFARGIELCSLSIALLDGGIPRIGIVAPLSGGVYYALRGEGSFLSHSITDTTSPTRLRVVCRSLQESVLDVTSHQGNAESRRLWWIWLEALKPPTCFRLRMIESAAMELCWLASGKIDGYLHPTDRLWDVAAGTLIAQEAGAVARSPDFHDWSAEKDGVIALTPVLEQHVRRVLLDAR